METVPHRVTEKTAQQGRLLASGSSEFFGQDLFVRFGAFHAEGLRDQALEIGKALGQLGKGLQQQQAKAQRDEHHHRPAYQAACVRGHLPAGQGGDKQRPAQVDKDQAQGNQKDDDAQDVDDGVGALAQLAGYKVDTHMHIAQEGVPAAEHEDRCKQVPLDLQQAVRANREGLAHDGIASADEYCRQNQPAHGFANGFVEAIDLSRCSQ